MAHAGDGPAGVRDADAPGADLPVGLRGRAGGPDRQEDRLARPARLRPDARAMVRHCLARHLRQLRHQIPRGPAGA